ncbi:response regulator transcription factor [Aliiglaciecola sp. CAU 1673]|uniref:response regulator transcription factor n=1 Tax=Aliiglaciecola sp. CAU 1673 TaxID=3032595 RepID=UPI0023DB22A1|nr:response regulator transcription factor [Aliiglaciecola sp. CAU 1673]MDF2177784.1 response regulator transcription factor [Aliiglaciecola sp. CAU 1673]
MTDKVLIVEDDADIADLLRVNLMELGVHTEHQVDGQLALERALDEDFALLVLDLMLPGKSGLEVCRELRQAKPAQAILMLTAKNAEMDRVLGLELGADDYMTKPFSVRELQARAKAQLRRVHLLADTVQDQQHMLSSQPLELGRLRIDPSRRQASLGNQCLDLTATEFELLSFFARHPNQVFSRSQLLESVWGYHHSGYEHTVNSHINRLRAKVEVDANTPAIIQTVWGVGYKLNEQGVQPWA